jgi:FkbM family methyltransferase
LSPHRLIVTHDPHADWVATRIRRTGFWEIQSPRDIASLAESAQPLPATGTLLDVGANIGYYTLLFSHAGWRVIAVEALSTNRRAIETSLCLNPDLRAHVTLVGAAVGNPTGGESCVVRSQHTRNVGDGVMTCGPDVGACSRRNLCERVQLTTLDRILAEHAPAAIDVVKMDIEGAECAALAGGQSLFTRYRPSMLQLELKEAHVDACAPEQARQHGYRIGSQRGNDNNAVLVRS